jgi:hypothetical protein
MPIIPGLHNRRAASANGKAESPEPEFIDIVPDDATLLAVADRAEEEVCRVREDGPLDLDCPDAILLGLLERMLDRPAFPLHVFPSPIRAYVEAWAASIHCPIDLLAVPLLAVAGAAIGRAKTKLRVKDGWDVSSCLWAVCLGPSSSGKTPALNAVLNFYEEKQEELHVQWEEAKAAWDNADEEERKQLDKPGPYPAIKLTDTTTESLRTDLKGGSVLFGRDELGAWSHQMGQYKGNNADRFDWCSLWSHSPVNVGRKAERVYVKEPFCAVTGMMVPGSVRELNYRGQADDGFVHRMLLAHVDAMEPLVTDAGVDPKLTETYKRLMTQLFDPPPAPGGKPSLMDRTIGPRLTFDPMAWWRLKHWANGELFRELRPTLLRPNWRAPDWLVSKYRKLFENGLRISLILHELWRVCRAEHEPADWEPSYRKITFGRVVERFTVEKAIAVINYFKAHIPAVTLLLEGSKDGRDEVDRTYNRLKSAGKLTVRETIHRTAYKSNDMVLALFGEWQRRGYGSITNPRKNSTVFVFAKDA